MPGRKRGPESTDRLASWQSLEDLAAETDDDADRLGQRSTAPVSMARRWPLFPYVWSPFSGQALSALRVRVKGKCANLAVPCAILSSPPPSPCRCTGTVS